MQTNHQPVSQSGTLVLIIVLANAVILERGLVASEKWYGLLLITIPLFLFSILFSKK